MADTAKTIVELRKLPVEDRLQIVEELWDSIDEDSLTSSFDTDPDFIAELERGIEEMKRDPNASISLEEFRTRMRNLRKSRST